MIPREWLTQTRRGIITGMRADAAFVRELEAEGFHHGDPAERELRRALWGWLLAKGHADDEMVRAIEAALEIQPLGRVQAPTA